MLAKSWTLILMALAGSPALAAPAALPPGVAFYSAAEIPGTVGKPLAMGPTYNQGLYLRTVDGEVEIHRDWNDTFLVLEGRATVVLGGKVEGARQPGPGESLGGTQSGGVAQAVGPGDVLFIPASTPHHTRLAPGVTAFRTFVFKSRP